MQEASRRLVGYKEYAWRYRHIAFAVVGLTLMLSGLAQIVIQIRSQGGNWPVIIGQQISTDLGVYLTATDAVTRGISPYDKSLFNADPYGYPPFFAELLALPYKVLGVGRDWFLWVLAMVGCLTASIVLILKSLGVRSPWSLGLLIAGVFVSARIGRVDLFHGQPNFLLLFLFVMGFLLFRQGRTAAGALSWAVMMVCKPFLGAAVFFLFRRGQWRALMTSLVFGGVLFLASFAILPNSLAVFQGWREATRWYSSLPNVAKPANQSLYGVLNRLFVETPYSEPWLYLPQAIPYIMAVATLLAIAVLMIGVSRKEVSKGIDPREAIAHDWWQVCLPILVYLVLGPISESNHTYLMMPALFSVIAIACWRWQSDGPNAMMWCLAAAAWLTLFLVLLTPFRMMLFSPSSWGQISGIKTLASGWNGFFSAVACLTTVAASCADRLRRTSADLDYAESR